MGTSRRRFSREFKLEAVRMVAGGRHSLAQVARELDLRPEMLRRWKRQVERDGDQAFPGHSRLKADDEQLRQLLRENLRLRPGRPRATPWLPIAWVVGSRSRPRTRSGVATSPTSGPGRVGSISRC